MYKMMYLYVTDLPIYQGTNKPGSRGTFVAGVWSRRGTEPLQQQVSRFVSIVMTLNYVHSM